MKVLPSLDQRSSEWHTWRNAGLGSSDAAKIVGLSPWGSASEVLITKRLLRKGLKPEEQADNSAMARGRRNEPLVLAQLCRHHGHTIEPICGLHDSLDWLRASLDGYCSHCGLVVEIKCPKREDHLAALSGQVPLHYWPQVHHQLLVSGAEILWYVSWSDYFPTQQQLAIVQVRRSKEQAYLDLLLQAEQDFWNQVLGEKEPEVAPRAAKRAGRKRKCHSVTATVTTSCDTSNSK